MHCLLSLNVEKMSFSKICECETYFYSCFYSHLNLKQIVDGGSKLFIYQLV